MGLKKRRLSRLSAASQANHATKDCSSERAAQSAVRKVLGFFGHITWQASGLSERSRLAVMRTIKAAIAPLNLLNPHRVLS
jgi:hypothetical protein